MVDGPPSPDLAIGSFTDHGPWVVDPEAMTWRRDVDRLRAEARAAYPRWMVTGRLPPLGRLARVVIMYVAGTSEDPALGAHDAFVDLITPVAADKQYFGPLDSADTICRYLNDYQPRAKVC